MEATPQQLNHILFTLAGMLEKDDVLQKPSAERQRKPGKQPPHTSRIIARTHSAKALPSKKNQSLTRTMSVELVDRTNTVPGSAVERQVLDMEWAPKGPETNSLSWNKPTLARNGSSTGGATAIDLSEGAGMPPPPVPNSTRRPQKRPEPSTEPHNASTRSGAPSMPPPPPPLPPPQSASAHRRNEIVKALASKPETLPQGRPTRTLPMPAPPLPPAPFIAKPATRQVTNTSSQSSSRAPPALGMRRYNGTSAASGPFNPSQELPMKRKGFKTPFARPSSGSQASDSSAVSSKASGHRLFRADTDSSDYSFESASSTGDGPAHCDTLPPPSPPPVAASDADSSFDISFDVDPIALEEEMRKYD